MGENNLEKCHVFICYRQEDGLAAADWLYERLHGRTIELERSNETLQLDVYLDRDAPAVDNWQEIWLPKLQVARALLFVCTPSAARQRDGTDWVYRELDKWITLRQSGPIVIDATGEADKYLPKIIQQRWPNAQRIVCRPDVWEKLPETQRRQQAERVISRILRGIRISEEGYWLEELERLRRLNRKLFRRLLATAVLFVLAVVLAVASRIYQLRAEREEIIATAGQLSARSAFLRQQDGPSLETSVLLAKRAHELSSQVDAPSLSAWRALDAGIELLPGKLGSPLYPFGAGVPAQIHVGEKAVLFVHKGAVPKNGRHSALWSYDKSDGDWKHIRNFDTTGHGELVTVSADGRRLVTRRADRFTVWDTADGHVVREIPDSAADGQRSAVSLSQGGRWFAVHADGKLHVHDLHADRATPRRTFALDRTSRAVFSPDDKHLAYADEEALILHSLESGDVLRRTPMPPGTDQVSPPIFSPDGDYLAVRLGSNQTMQVAPSATPGGVNHKVAVWQVPDRALPPAGQSEAGWQPVETIVREDRFDIVFSPTMETPRLAILERAQPVQVLDLFSKASFTLSAGDRGARAAAFAYGALLTVNWDGTARLWSTMRRAETRRLTQAQPVVAAYFLQARYWGGASVLTMSNDGEVRLWGRPRQSMVTAAGPSRLFEWNASGDHIVSADSVAYRTDPATGAQVEIPLSMESGHAAVAAALGPEGRYAAFATKWAPPGQPQTLRLVDVTGESTQIDLPLDHHFEVKELAVGEGGSTVLAETRRGAVLVWTPAAKAREERLRVFDGAGAEPGMDREASAVLLDPGGGWFLRVSGDVTTKVVRRGSSGEVLDELQLPTPWHASRLRRAWQMSRSGEYLALPADDAGVFIVQTRGLVAARITLPQDTKLLQVDDTGRLLLRAEDAFLVVNQAGDTLYRLADASSPDTGRLSADGRLLAVLESNGEVTVWDLEAGFPLASFHADSKINGVLFGPAANHLVLLRSRGFRIRLWQGKDMARVAASLIGRKLTADELRTEGSYTRTH